MSIIQTVTGYVSQKGVQELELGGQPVYKINMRKTLVKGRGEKAERQTVLVSVLFWGKYNSSLMKFVAPYDQITVIGELQKQSSYTNKDSGEEIPIFEMNGMHYSLPKRDDADGANKTRSTKQRVETLKPDPAGVDDEEIPF